MKTTLIYMYVTAATATATATALVACSGSPHVDAQKYAPAQSVAATEQPAKWTIEPVTSTLGVGKTADLRIDVALRDHWHIYSITQPAGGPKATRITVPAGQPFVLASEPRPTIAPEMKYDDAFRMTVQEHERSVGFIVPIRATGSADSVRVDVRYQVCNASLCYPPQTTALATAVLVKG